MLFGCAEPYIEYLTCMTFSCSGNIFLHLIESKHRRIQDTDFESSEGWVI
jgi:hypothetical protein